MSDPMPDNEQTSARGNAQDKLASIQRKQARQGRRGSVIALVVAVVLIVGIGAGGVGLWRSQQQSAPSVGSAELGKVKSYSGLSRDHVDSGYKYEQQPPVGGAHNPAWANCGIYDKTILPQYAVHSLEHGAVWITYKSGLPKGQVDALKAKVNKQQGYMLMSVDNKQSSPIVLTAWGKQLHVASPDDASVDKFIQDFWKGPQTPEPGAACEGAYDPNTGAIGG